MIARWVAGIQQNFCNDPNNAAITPASLQCPLTLQDMLILLRNVLMTAFRETQAAVHAIYPIVPASDNDSQYVPFVVSVNTCYLTSTDMKLPTYIVENIRTLVARHIHRGGNDYEWFVPVLCMKKGQVLDEALYTYTFDGVTYPSFVPSASYAKKKVGVGKEARFEVLAQDPIDLIDGSYVGGYCYINDPKALETNVASWENWFEKSGLSNYSVPVGPLGTENGINALCSVNCYRVVGDIQETRKRIAAERNAKKDVVFARDEKRFDTVRGVRDPIFEEQQVIWDATQSKFIGTAYEQIQKGWILPVINTQTDANNLITPVRWQCIMGDTFSTTKSNSLGEGESIDDILSSYAARCTRGKLTPADTWTDLFKDLAAQGRGGILSGIIANIADVVWPGAGAVVTQVGKTLGI